MAMGIVSDEEFEAELINSGITKNEITIEDVKQGRGNKEETPEIIRELVGQAAINGEGTREIAEAFNVSESSVSAYKVGAHSTASYHNPNKSLLTKLTDHRLRISKKASARLLSALNEITPDKLSVVKTRDLAAIAKDMASIVKDMEPQVSPGMNGTNNVQFVFMAPRVRDIEEFKIIEVKE